MTAPSSSSKVDLASPSATLVQSDVGVNDGSSLVYAMTTPKPLAAGSYSLTATDFQFPAALPSLQFAVAQSASIIQRATAAGTLNFTTSAVDSPAVLLVNAVTPTAGSGMFDINVQTTGSAPQVVFDQTQGASATGGVFSTQPIAFANAGDFDVTLSDLKFPVQFANLALLISNNGAVLGKIYGGGTFTINATSSTYQLNFVTTPGPETTGGAPQYGLFGVQVVNSAPTATLTASPTTVLAGASTTLTWTSTDATACAGAGGSFTGGASSGSATVAVPSTTTFTLKCTGPGGTGTATATVTATAAPAKSGGGGSIDFGMLTMLGLLAFSRFAAMRLQGPRCRAV